MQKKLDPGSLAVPTRVQPDGGRNRLETRCNVPLSREWLTAPCSSPPRTPSATNSATNASNHASQRRRGCMQAVWRGRQGATAPITPECALIRADDAIRTRDPVTQGDAAARPGRGVTGGGAVAMPGVPEPCRAPLYVPPRLRKRTSLERVVHRSPWTRYGASGITTSCGAAAILSMIGQCG